MLRLIRRFLARYRWPLAVGIATLFLLAYLLQPRPMAEYRLLNDSTSAKISPSGRYLATRRDNALQIYQTEGLKLILTHAWHDAVLYEFDQDDGVVFATYASSTLTPEGATLQLWY